MIAMLPTPPMVQGQDARELVQVRRYLFRLVEELNRSLNSLSADNFTPEAAQTLSGGKAAEKTQQELTETKNELRSLIIRNAKEVAAEIETITEDLESNYVAQGQFGIYQESFRNEITASSQGLSQAITGTSQVLGQYIADTQGYIRQGVVGYENGAPVIGIAIGQNITVTDDPDVEVGGKSYKTIDKRQNMSVWTTRKLSFYVGGAEVAYFANNALTVNQVSTSGLTLGENWEVSTSGGLIFNWIGGNA